MVRLGNNQDLNRLRPKISPMPHTRTHHIVIIVIVAMLTLCDSLDITHYTKSLIPRIHVNTANFLTIMCTLVATCLILGTLECTRHSKNIHSNVIIWNGCFHIQSLRAGHSAQGNFQKSYALQYQVKRNIKDTVIVYLPSRIESNHCTVASECKFSSRQPHKITLNPKPSITCKTFFVNWIGPGLQTAQN